MVSMFSLLTWIRVDPVIGVIIAVSAHLHKSGHTNVLKGTSLPDV